MSFSLNVPPTPRDEFLGALEAAELSPPDAHAGAVVLGKALAGQIFADLLGEQNECVQATISGHIYDGSEHSYKNDSLTVSVSGCYCPEQKPEAASQVVRDQAAA